MKKAQPAYTKADLAKWNADLLFKQPASRPQGPLVKGVSIVSFRMGVSRNGAYILINDGYGDNDMPIMLNPVIAAALRDAIDHAGREGGWLDSDGNPVLPALDR